MPISQIFWEYLLVNKGSMVVISSFSGVVNLFASLHSFFSAVLRLYLPPLSIKELLTIEITTTSKMPKNEPCLVFVPPFRKRSERMTSRGVRTRLLDPLVI